MIASDISSSHANRKLWLWRIAAIAIGCAGAACAAGVSRLFHLPRVAEIALDFVAIIAAVIIAMRAEASFAIDDVARSDAELISRFKWRGVKFVVWTMPVFVPLYIAGQALGKGILHLSHLETFVLSMLPVALVMNVIRRFYPISAGSKADTRRAMLLMMDRNRRVSIRVDAILAVLSVVGVAMLVPDLLRAVHGLPVHPGAIQDFAFLPMMALLNFAAPWPWRQEPEISDLQTDETLSRYRLIACRNGFVAMAVGLIVVADLATNLRLAMMLVPAVLNIAVGITFATLAVLEHRAGRSAEGDAGDRDEAAGA